MIRNIPDVYHRWKSSSAYRPFFLTSRVLLVFIVAVSLASVTPFYRVLKSTTRAAHSQTSNPIQHIIILLKENRTFDSKFGTFPGANGATTYTDPNGVVYPLNHQPDHLLNDIKHDHKSAILAEDNGKMDKFSLIHGAIQNGVDEADLPSLTSFDGQSNDMFNAFNFNQTPLPPLILQKRSCPATNIYISPQDDTD